MQSDLNTIWDDDSTLLDYEEMMEILDSRSLWDWNFFSFFIWETLRLSSREILGRVILRALWTFPRHFVEKFCRSKDNPLWQSLQLRDGLSAKYATLHYVDIYSVYACSFHSLREFHLPFTLELVELRNAQLSLGLLLRNRQGTLSLSLACSKVVRSNDLCEISCEEIWILILYRWKGGFSRVARL